MPARLEAGEMLCIGFMLSGEIRLKCGIAFQGEYFMVQDVYSKADVLNTTGSYGAPNFRQIKGSYPLYGMGQPSLNGFRQVLQRLQAQGHEVTVIFLCLHIYIGRMYTQ